MKNSFPLKPPTLAADLFLNSSNYETPIDDAALCGDYVFHGLYARGGFGHAGSSLGDLR